MNNRFRAGNVKEDTRQMISRIKNGYNNRKMQWLIENTRGKRKTINVSDMFYLQIANKELIRYDMIVRYLAIENYYGKNEIGFELYKKMQDERIGHGYSEKAITQFKALIRSYEENGYDESSYIAVDKELHLLDGSHRMALAMYHHIEKVNMLVIDVSKKIDYSIDWFLQKGFSDGEIDMILETAERIKKEVNTPFSCVIWNPASRYKQEIMKDLGYFGEVTNHKEYCFRPGEYKNIVRSVYAIDDIAKWKIEKKLEYMGDDACEVVAVDLIFDDPAFRIKAATGMPLSKCGERAKKALRTRYQPCIDNYFFDVIMHIGDNHMQSEYMRKVFEPGINFREVLEILNRFQYVLTKIDVPYMPAEFPDRIPVGKDIDVICAEKDFRTLERQLMEYAKQYSEYEIVVRDYQDRLLLRFELSGKLILQIDCGCRYEGMSDEFLKLALQSRYLTNEGYYILDTAFEAIIRRLAFEADSSKKYHEEYYMKYKTDEKVDLFEKIVRGGVRTEKLLPELCEYPAKVMPTAFRLYTNECCHFDREVAA